MATRLVRNDSDLELARAAATGSLPVWQEFVARYSALILSTVRRYMHGFDNDDHRTVYVEVLQEFYRVGLRRYDGTVSLASWVMIVTRSRCLDAVRARLGRNRCPSWLKRFSKLERDVYRLHYVEGLDLGVLVEALHRLGHPIRAEEVPDILDRLDARMNRRLRTRLAYELQARSSGGFPARLLEFLDERKRWEAEAGESLRPDAILIENQARDLLAKIRVRVEELPPDERRAVELRYWTGMSTGDVATRMGLADRRAAHGLIRRAVDRLRAALDGGETPCGPSDPDTVLLLCPVVDRT